MIASMSSFSARFQFHQRKHHSHEHQQWANLIFRHPHPGRNRSSFTDKQAHPTQSWLAPRTSQRQLVQTPYQLLVQLRLVIDNNDAISRHTSIVYSSTRTTPTHLPRRGQKINRTNLIGVGIKVKIYKKYLPQSPKTARFLSICIWWRPKLVC